MAGDNKAAEELYSHGLDRAPDNAARVAAQELEVVCEPPAVFAARLKRETATWAEVIRSRGISAD